MFVNKRQFTQNDIITGEKFTRICDRIFFHYKDVDTTPIRNHEVFLYTDTYRLEDLVKIIPKNRRIVLVTHNSDRNIYDEMVEFIPENVVWFSQNVCTKSSNVKPLPIGLENERWFAEINKKTKLLDKNKSNVLPKKLLYVNHAIWTNPNARQPVYDYLLDKKWATCMPNCKNGINYDNYLDDIVDHFYVASPQGNGNDCHRTWEVLYANRVPIVIRNSNNSMFEGLPVLIIDAWEELTEDFLQSKMSYFTTHKFDGFEKLTFDFWKQQIRNSL